MWKRLSTTKGTLTYSQMPRHIQQVCQICMAKSWGFCHERQNDLSTLEDDKSIPSLFLLGSFSICICLRRKVWALQSICGRGLWWWEHIFQKTFDSVLKTAGKGAIGKAEAMWYRQCCINVLLWVQELIADGTISREPKMFKLHRSLNRIHRTSSQSEFQDCLSLGLSLRIGHSWKR